MVFKSFCIFLPWTKVPSAWKGITKLSLSRLFHLIYILPLFSAPTNIGGLRFLRPSFPPESYQLFHGSSPIDLILIIFIEQRDDFNLSCATKNNGGDKCSWNGRRCIVWITFLHFPGCPSYLTYSHNQKE